MSYPQSPLAGSVLGGQSMRSALAAACRTALNVERSTSDLEASLREMGDAVAALEDVVAPLLSSAVDDSLGSDRAPADSEVAERIMLQADAAGRYAARIRSLIARL